ncbi:hypothetical protein ACFV6F_30610 [Kitasatospora phosalacinea]|uniref:hypothetical protein n=1 Tax=Kitasatospora phosalacinea TaxID=2065 RepID=UPI003650D1A0
MRLSGALRGRNAVLLGTALAVAAEAVPGLPGTLRTAAGLWLLLGAPVAVWRGAAARVVGGRDSALLLAVGLALVTDLLLLLGLNTVLPLFGDRRPLTTTAIAGTVGMALVLIGAFTPEEPRPPRPARTGPVRGLRPVALLGGAASVLSVAGAIRLNNGLGGGVSAVALLVVGALLVTLLVRRRRYPEQVLELGLYLAAAALLLLNSLRGWTIAGHDIQREFEYFRLTLGGELWNVGLYRDAYNACLSITLFPVALVRLTAVQDIWVFKVVLPLLFALTPVLVHRAVRNVAPRSVALLSAVLFVAFPTFFTDMTFLGRQEIAFLLLACAVMVLTDRRRPLRRRRWTFTVLLVGCVLSHYSTTYVVVATMALAVAFDLLWRTVERFTGQGRRRRGLHERGPAFLTLWMVALPAVLALVWAGPVTHTGNQLRSTLSAIGTQLLHPGAQHGSSDTSYSLFGGQKVSPEQRLEQYRQESVTSTAEQRLAGDYLPLQAVEGYPTPVVPQADQPLTALGRALQSAGLGVAGLNGAARQGAALLFQVLVLVGFGVVAWSRKRAFQPTRDQLTLTAGALGMVAAFTLLPQLSVDYSVLRAFQQGLLFFAPVLAAGLLWLLRWAGRRTVPVAVALVAALFLDLTGVVPKVLGGYPAQLQLSNAGQYYDIYYPHPEERAAAFWLQNRIAGDPKQLTQTDRFSFRRLQTMITGPAQGEVYPTLTRANAYVLLGTTTVTDGRATIFYQGDLITYQYPRGVLDASKNRIYSSEGAEIYR